MIDGKAHVSIQQASQLLGISCALVVLAMDRGDLPFLQVGGQRSLLLSEVQAFNERCTAQREAMAELVEDSADLLEPGHL